MKLREITKAFQIEPNILKHVFGVMEKKYTLNYMYKTNTRNGQTRRKGKRTE